MIPSAYSCRVFFCLFVYSSCLTTFQPPGEMPSVWSLWLRFLFLPLSLHLHPPLLLQFYLMERCQTVQSLKSVLVQLYSAQTYLISNREELYLVCSHQDPQLLRRLLQRQQQQQLQWWQPLVVDLFGRVSSESSLDLPEAPLQPGGARPTQNKHTKKHKTHGAITKGETEADSGPERGKRRWCRRDGKCLQGRLWFFLVSRPTYIICFLLAVLFDLFLTLCLTQ